MEVVFDKMPDDPGARERFWLFRCTAQDLIPFGRCPALNCLLHQLPGCLKAVDQLGGAASRHAWAIPVPKFGHCLASFVHIHKEPARPRSNYMQNNFTDRAQTGGCSERELIR